MIYTNKIKNNKYYFKQNLKGEKVQIVILLTASNSNSGLLDFEVKKDINKLK